MQGRFIAAIRTKNKVSLTFYSKEDAEELTRVCAPMDYGPSRRAKDKSDRYHLWDYESDKRNHVLSLLPDQVTSIVVLPQKFEPAGFMAWPPNWFITRDWGRYS